MTCDYILKKRKKYKYWWLTLIDLIDTQLTATVDNS